MKDRFSPTPPAEQKSPPLSPQRRGYLASIAEEIFVMSTLAWRLRQRRTAGRDLSETEYLTLDMLANEGTLTVGQLQRRIGVLPAQMSRIIRSLEGSFARPMIACAINVKDKRKVDVALTEFGRQAHDQFRDAWLSQAVDLLRHVADEELGDFMRVIRKIRQAVTVQQPGNPSE